MKSLTGNIPAYLELCKLRISMFAAFSSLSGFLLASAGFKYQTFLLVTGVFSLASGACALNQYQERDIDALMSRTKIRPIPSGRIKPHPALFFSVTLMSLGLAVLCGAGGATAAFLGLLAVLWYNGVYTYLKRKTAFAAIPGSVVGAVPPVIGYIAGGGHIGNPGVVFLCFLFFMWQVPHFWLLMLDHGEEYRTAGLPALTEMFTGTQLARVVFSWITATAVSCLFIVVAGVILSPLIRFFLLGCSLWLILNGTRLLQERQRKFAYGFAFRRINIYILLVMTLLSIDRLLI